MDSTARTPRPTRCACIRPIRRARATSSAWRDALGDEIYSTLELFDIGDVVGVTGPLFRTRTGEVTVRVTEVCLLAKSLRPLPFGKEEEVDGVKVRHSGFADAEQRYR